jgi:polyferredoxin
MKAIKIVGLFLFVAGFLLFNGSFFLARYTMTRDVVKQYVHNQEKQRLFLEESSALLNREVNSNFEFVRRLLTIFEDVNDHQIQRYAFTDRELEELAKASKEKLDLSKAFALLQGDPEVQTFKRKALNDYAGWLDGKAVTLGQWQEVSDKIKRYGTTNQVGFDRYATKDLTFAMTKDATQGPVRDNPLLYLFLTFGLCILGAMLFILPKLQSLSGIKNNGIFTSVMKNRGWLGVLTGTWLILFYVLLYFFPEYMTNWIIMADPVSLALNGNEAGRFFLYGFIYTLCILVMGVRMMIQYRHSKYQIFRTISVMFFQLGFAFLIPEILIRLNKPYFDFKNIWPLDYDFFFESEIAKLLQGGNLGIFMLGWGIALIIIGVPVFVYFFGKRWYCSWVCGCGGLAETLGDPYRQLSNKTIKAWRIERWMIHGVLVFAVVMTGAVLYTYWTGSSWFLFIDSYQLRSIYGAWIGAGFAGVVGTGFYPLMGNRVWCRFGCPLAAYLGLIQRFKSRFRITTNGGQCISCGNCSTYCEMGIDVRWYAQRGQNIVRSSCVGCGICSAVCPRGVLNLELKDEKERFGKPILIGNNNINVLK